MDGDTLGLAGRIFLALLLGGVIGLEREVNGHPAGFRTHVTVAIGAALFGIISVDGFARFEGARADTNVQIDVTRVASQVVVGIGFLGAGTIVKHHGAVRGLTTAASLWVAAAVGLGVGVGTYAAPVITTVALLLTLVVLRWPRRWVVNQLSTRRRTATIALEPDADVGGIVGALHALDDVEVRSIGVRTLDRGSVVEVDLKAAAGVDLDAALTTLADRDDVSGIELA